MSDYYVHIRYSDSPDGSGGLSEKPQDYMGVYIGLEEVAPSDPSLYTWSKYYGAESTYIDIRYSDNGEEFTENNGLEVGSWIGFYITSDPAVLEENYIPIWENYDWTDLSTKAPEITPFYYIESDYQTIYKFFTSNETFAYTPSSLKLSFMVRQAELTGPVTRGTIQAYYTYTLPQDSTTILTSEIIISNTTTLELNLAADIFSGRNVQNIVIQGLVDNNLLLTQIYQAIYGTSEDMAKLSLNAADIVASIQNTKLLFNTDGLTIRNGGFTILNSQDERVFYADNDGNLFFSGTLNSTNGALGGWTIDEHGLYADNKSVGLYAGGDLIHPRDITNTPIRFWAGQTETIISSTTGEELDRLVDYNFAVNHDGILFANNADIVGKIVATDGYIKNKFLVGSTDTGIIIYGGDELVESYIGSSLYSSGSLGYGWKLSQDGTAEFNNITARGKIQSSVFEYNKISSVGGSLYIAPTIYAESRSSQLTSLGSSKDSNSLSNFQVSWTLPYSSLQDINGRDWNIGDEIKLDGEILTEAELIALSDIDGTIIEANSNSDSTIDIQLIIAVPTIYEEKIKNKTFEPGAILILYGSNSQRHGLYLTAAGQHSPFMDVYDDAEDNIIKPAVRIGNLGGITDANFPEEALSGYGLYSSNAYLRGQLMLPGAGITNQTNTLYGEGTAASPIRIWAGINNTGDNITNANFIVTANGYMYAKQGIFEGTVKARNSEFSGTIKAAGIVIEDNGTGTTPQAQPDHFFVAYTSTPETFHDYVLDISSNGLSVWEGGLRAYSDYASNVYPENTVVNPVYGYDNTHTSPLPYFSLADDGNGTELHARIVAHKGHFLTVKQENSVYKTNSIIFDNGIWFDEGDYNNFTGIEKTAYYQSLHNNGIFLDDGLINIHHTDGVKLTSEKTIYINPLDDDIQATHVERLFIRGQLNLVKEGENDNLLSLNGQVIKEAFDKNGKSIGIDILVS